MAKKSNKSSYETSFFNDVIKASVADFIEMFGEPDDNNNTGEDKVNYEWTCETSDGHVFTIYDWKEYRPISQSEIIGWHIGGESSKVTRKALNEIAMMILIKHQK